MIAISDELEAIYIHIPKNGGTYVKNIYFWCSGNFNFNKINVIKGSDYSFNQIDLLPVSTEIAYKLQNSIKESEQFVYTRQNNFTDASKKIQEHVQLLKNIHHAIQNTPQG